MKFVSPGILLITISLLAGLPAISAAVPQGCDAHMSVAAQDVRFPSVDTVMEIHARDINQFGGMQGIRAPELLESAIESTRATFGGEDLYPTVFDKAAALAVHISESQPFFDGNKRTALDSALTLLGLNGYDIRPQSMELFNAIVGVANKSVSREQLAAMFSTLAQRAAPARVPAAIESEMARALHVSDRVRREQSHVFAKLFRFDRHEP